MDNNDNRAYARDAISFETRGWTILFFFIWNIQLLDQHFLSLLFVLSKNYNHLLLEMPIVGFLDMQMFSSYTMCRVSCTLH